MGIVLFLLTIIVLVGVHELGHFLAARAFGVYIHEFSIGMGPILASRKRGETLYAVRLIPIGGYVRMAGEDRLETGDAIPAARVLHNKPPYVRMLISLTGPMMNAILALVVILAVAWSVNLPILQIVDTVPGSAASGVFQSGDRLLAIAGKTIYTSSEITRAIQASNGQPIDFVIRRAGTEQTVTVQPRMADNGTGYLVGIEISTVAETNEITALSAASPLYVAGVEVGDRIGSVNGATTDTESQLVAALGAALQTNAPIALTILRNGVPIEITLRASGRTVDQVLQDVRFVDLGMDYHRTGFRTGLRLGLQDFATYATLLATTLRDLVAGSPEARAAVAGSVSGPVGIADMIGKSITYGFLAFVQILGFLSLNFAIINLIPFPGLDGSRVVFAIVEWIRGKPIPPQREGLIHAIGFVLILVLLVLVTYRDILRLLG